MKHKEEETSYDGLYYTVGLLAGLAIGVILDNGFILVPILGIVGLLAAGFFQNVFVRDHGQA